MSTFLPAMWPAFFIRVRPASRKAKPACMNITSTAVITTQIVLAAIRRSPFLGTGLHLLELASRAVVGDAVDCGAPHDPVARLVPAAGGIRDRLRDLLGDVVLHEEDQQRLREKPRFEHA